MHLSKTGSDRLLFGLLLGVIVVGVYLRLYNYGFSPLWLDEAWRADFILAPGWFAAAFEKSSFSAITPIGYVILNRAFASVSVTAASLRMSSLVPGILTMPAAYVLVKRVTNSGVWGLLASWLVAICPPLIEYSKELKPYSLELFLHFIILGSYFSVSRKISTDRPKKNLRLIFLVFLIGISFSISATTVFVAPGVLGLLLLELYRIGYFKTFRFLAVCTLLLLLEVGLAYHFCWSAGASKNGLVSFWSENFYIDGSFSGYCLWSVKSSLIPMLRMYVFPVSLYSNSLNTLTLQNSLLAVSFFGFLLALKRSPERLVLVLPAVLMVVFNYLRIWPMGPIRVNLFSCAYFLSCTLVGLDTAGRGAASFILRGRSRRYWGCASLPVFVLILGCSVTRDFKSLKANAPPFQNMPATVHALVHKLAGPEFAEAPLLINGSATYAYRFYTEHQVIEPSAPLIDSANHKFSVFPDTDTDPVHFDAHLLQEPGKVFNYLVIWSHLSRPEVRKIEAAATRSTCGFIKDDFGGAGLLELTCPGQSPAERPHGRHRRDRRPKG